MPYRVLAALVFLATILYGIDNPGSDHPVLVKHPRPCLGCPVNN
jgi:hypothetical protein